MTPPGPLFRCLRGELPPAFWTPDAQNMVCATDPAFMSCSPELQATYMDPDGPNLVWKLLSQCAQSNEAYHIGADISFISQFAGEAEVLYPPNVMMTVSEESLPPPVGRRASRSNGDIQPVRERSRSGPSGRDSAPPAAARLASNSGSRPLGRGDPPPPSPARLASNSFASNSGSRVVIPGGVWKTAQNDKGEECEYREVVAKPSFT